MFAHARLSNLGPIEAAALALNGKGTTVLSGPSQSGKSTTLAAIAAPWTGKLPALRDGADKGGVELTTGGGVVIRMGRTAAGGESFSVHAKGAEKPTRYPSWSAMAADPALAMHPARDPELAAAIVLPFAWAELLQKGCGRPLRNLLMRVLPSVSLAERIAELVKAAGYTLDEADLEADTGGKAPQPVPADHPTYPAQLVKTLERRQTEANKIATAARATAAEARRNQGDLVVAPNPGPESAYTAAQTTVATARAWDAHDAAVTAYKADLAIYTEERAALATWQKSRGALAKEEPTLSGAERMAARQRVEKAEAEVKRLETEERNAELAAAVERTRQEERERAAAAPSPAVVAPVAPGPVSGPAPTLFASAEVPVFGPAVCPACKRPLETN